MSTSSRTLQWIVTALLLVLLLSVGFAAAVFYHPAMRAMGAEVTGAPASVDPEVFAPPPVPSAEPVYGTGVASPAPESAAGAVPEAETLTDKIAGLDRSEAIGEDDEDVSFAVAVRDAETGEALGGMAQDKLLIPASNTKTLTALAALSAMDSETTFATRVVQPEPGRIVLVGGGDPLLAGETPDDYPQAASLDALSATTATALQDAGITAVELDFDASLFEESWNATWPENYRSQVTPLSALWVDGGRTDAGRSQTPAQDATARFAELLAKRGIRVTNEEPAQATASGTEIARVESPPLHVLVEMAMLRSDNSWTEAIGFQTALAMGEPATFAGSVAAIEQQLRELGIWQDGAVLHDASGLSRSNLVSADMLAQVNQHILEDPNLSVIIDGLPVAGVTGTLHDRFKDPATAPARGVAKAKTGTLTGVSTLSGATVTHDGRVVTFAVMVNGSSEPWMVMMWIDQVVGAITGCGC